MSDENRRTGGYKPTFLDRQGQKGVSAVRAMVGGVVCGLLAGIGAVLFVVERDLPIPAAVATVLLTPPVVGYLVVKILVGGAEAAGAGFLHFLYPSGSSTPYEPQYSNVEAMVMRSDFAGAAAEYERIIREAPGLAEPRLRAVEVYSRHLSNPIRAAELLREVQRIPDVAARDDLRASNRLVDLLISELNQPGKALVELRRIADRYAGTAAGDHARSAIANLKSGHLPDQPGGTAVARLEDNH